MEVNMMNKKAAKRPPKERAEGTGRVWRTARAAFTSLTPESPRADAQREGRQILIGLLVTRSSEDEHSVGLGTKVQVRR